MLYERVARYDDRSLFSLLAANHVSVRNAAVV